ncbi:hypothetical protein [Sphingobium sp. HDIP04]|uniref:hypothetical protein n=1 Tax=Sphingobium sp. HDIP04 TaxID=428994 RepID=UPI0003875A1F|nr:hypothetical protein [Sphingobium sp. HDIP04]EQB03890.1 hypothetical protein L286_11030 [Sphingobium sp. HDIP04]
MTEPSDQFRMITEREWREVVDILSQLNAGLIILNKALFGEAPISEDDKMGEFGQQFFELHRNLQFKIGKLVGVEGGDENG